MAQYLPAYEIMIKMEGGYKLITVPGDKGGMTYAGISRRANPYWPGWKAIDAGKIPDTQMVHDFYKENHWDKINGDRINSQKIAQNIFTFGVLSGEDTASKLAQIVVGVTPDGDIGPKSLAALNDYQEDLFVVSYAIAKVTRIRDIVTRDRTQEKFLLGWINRILGGIA